MIWNILIIAVMITTASTRLISYHFGIPASAYLALIPLFAGALLYPRPYTWRRIDGAVAALTAIPVLWFPVSGIIALNADHPFPWNQFFQQASFSLLMYTGYFATRFLPLRNPGFVFWAFLFIIGLAVPVLFLQQLGIVDQFYPLEDDSILAGFSDPTTGLTRFRNMGFFGNWHDAGVSVLLEFLAFYSLITAAKSQSGKFTWLAAMVLTLGGILLTSARAELVMAGLTLVSWQLFAEPFLLGEKGVMFRNLGRIAGVGLLVVAAGWVAFLNYPEIFAATQIVANGLDFIQREGRVGDNLNTIYFLADDPVRALFGWGMGSGGIPVTEGELVVPVNTVDLSFTINLANYGILGLLAYGGLLTYILAVLLDMRKHILRLTDGGRGWFTLRVMSDYSLIGVWCTILSMGTAFFIDNRVYMNLLFLVLGALVNSYDRILTPGTLPGQDYHAASLRAA